jgi:hypothetical protein
MLAMQPADILCQSSLPGDRHRQKQCVEPSVIKAFANVATCSEYQALLILRHPHCRVGQFAILHGHAAAQHDEISHEWLEPLLKIIEVVLPLSQHDGRSFRLKRFQHIIEEQIIPAVVLRQSRVDRRH